MYWEGVSASYGRFYRGKVIVMTTGVKTIVHYGDDKMNYELSCNCTPDVALNRIRFFEDFFRKKTGYELVGNVRVLETYDSGINMFFGVVRKGSIMIEVPVVIDKKSIIDAVRSELRFQERFVNKRDGYYSYFDGKKTTYYDSIEEIDALLQKDFKEVREYFGEEFFELFPGSGTYFRDFGKYTMYVVNDNNVIVSGLGRYSVCHMVERCNDVESLLSVDGGRPVGTIFIGKKPLRGSYFVKEDGFYLEYDVKAGKVFREDFLDVAYLNDFKGGIIGKNEALYVFDKGVVYVSIVRNMIQVLRVKRPVRRFGTMFRYMKFVPHPNAFTVFDEPSVATISLAIEGVSL